MPTILAIETSTRTGSVALARDGVLLSEETFVAERSHNSHIFAPLSELIGDAEIDAVVVGTGPGSYTGVRIGIATAIGISLARDIPLIGVPSVCGIDCDGDYRVVGDARRGSWFLAHVVRGEMTVDPKLMAYEAIEHQIKGEVFTFDVKFPDERVKVMTPAAGVLAKRQSLRALNNLPTAAVEPIYLAAPFITTPKGRGKTLD